MFACTFELREKNWQPCQEFEHTSTKTAMLMFSPLGAEIPEQCIVCGIEGCQFSPSNYMLQVPDCESGLSGFKFLIELVDGFDCFNIFK